MRQQPEVVRVRPRVSAVKNNDSDKSGLCQLNQTFPSAMKKVCEKQFPIIDTCMSHS
jgi:hypothetical protein